MTSPESPPLRTIHINTERTWRGGEKQALHLMRGLLDRGHHVEVVCPPGSPLEERAQDVGIPVHAVRMRGEANPVPTMRLRRIFARGSFDVCHMHTSHAHTFGVLARVGRRRPVTVVSRRVDFSIYRRGTLGLNWVKYRFGVDRYVAISRAIRDVMVRDGIASERIEVVHSGVTPPPSATLTRDDICQQLGLPTSVTLLGNVAHLANHKGQVFLVEAMARLVSEFPELHLVIAGEGEERPTLEAKIRELNLAKNVHLVGFQQDVASYLHAFDLFSMPSIMEGLCTSLLDALHCSLPVVASRTGGIPEIIRHESTGLLAAPGDSQELAAQLERLLRNRDWARELATEGKRVAESEFSVDQMIDGNVAVYRGLLNSRK